MERHIRDKHTEAGCPFCSAIFPNNNKHKYHVNNCMQNGTAKVKCDKCKQVFTSFGIKRHKVQCHKKKELICKECGMIANTAADLKNHMGKEHTAWQEKSHEVCYHFRNGFSFRGDSCRFAHVGVKRNTSGSTLRPAMAKS